MATNATLLGGVPARGSSSAPRTPAPRTQTAQPQAPARPGNQVRIREGLDLAQLQNLYASLFAGGKKSIPRARSPEAFQRIFNNYFVERGWDPNSLQQYLDETGAGFKNPNVKAGPIKGSKPTVTRPTIPNPIPQITNSIAAAMAPGRNRTIGGSGDIGQLAPMRTLLGS